MADFTTFNLQANTGTNAAPTWTALGGANTEIRWSDLGTGELARPSASWPAVIRPAATAILSFTYAYTADAVGIGFIGGGGNPATYSISNYLWARWNWDALGTFASAPIFTAYNTTAHTAPATRATPAGGLLEGHVTDTAAVSNTPPAFSYLKGNAFGRVNGAADANQPAAAPGAAPLVGSGTSGSVSPAAGANWLSQFQSLMADIDYITFPGAAPAPTVADKWSVHFAMFVGPNMTPGILVPVLSLKYTWT